MESPRTSSQTEVLRSWVWKAFLTLDRKRMPKGFRLQNTTQGRNPSGCPMDGDPEIPPRAKKYGSLHKIFGKAPFPKVKCQIHWPLSHNPDKLGHIPPEVPLQLSYSPCISSLLKPYHSSSSDFSTEPGPAEEPPPLLDLLKSVKVLIFRLPSDSVIECRFFVHF